MKLWTRLNGLKIKVDSRFLATALIVNICIILVTGIIENEPRFPHIPENKYHGLPLVWWMINTSSGVVRFYYWELLIDALFWLTVVLIALVLVNLVKS